VVEARAGRDAEVRRGGVELEEAAVGPEMAGGELPAVVSSRPRKVVNVGLLR
jgi:hypothetical protein